MTLCYVDHTGFHHRHIARHGNRCRCNLRFPDLESLQSHLESVSIGTAEHPVAEPR